MQNFALICFAPELSPHCFLNMQVRKNGGKGGKSPQIHNVTIKQ